VPVSVGRTFFNGLLWMRAAYAAPAAIRHGPASRPLSLPMGPTNLGLRPWVGRFAAVRGDDHP